MPQDGEERKTVSVPEGELRKRMPELLKEGWRIASLIWDENGCCEITATRAAAPN